MFSADWLGQMYQVTAVFGFGFFLLTAITARGAHSGGHAGHATHGLHHGGMGGHGVGGGHGVAGHGVAGHGVGGGHGVAGAHGAAGHGVAGGHGAAGHGVAGGHGAAAHGAAGHGASGARVGGARGPIDTEGAVVQGATGQAITGPMHTPHEIHRISPVELFLTILNPMRMASFLLFFGLIGRLTQLLCPWLGLFTLIPGIIAGLIGSHLILQFFGFIYSKLQSSSLAVVDNLIGQMADVTVPIPAGRMGEITYIVESKRITSAAKAFKAGGGFAKGDKVMIVNIDSSIAYVEPWDEAEFTQLEPAGKEDSTVTIKEVEKEVVPNQEQ